MADGHFEARTWSAQTPLREAAGADRRLMARCATPGCGAAAQVDPAGWLAEGLGGQSLWAFCDRLRCVCGARSVALQVEDGGPAEPRRRGPIYVFR